MKSRIAAVVLALLVSAGVASAAEMQTVLTSDSILYAIEARGEYWRLDLDRRNGETKTTLVVPGTDNDAIESDARLLWDSKRSMLFVAWHSVENDRDAVMLASLDTDGVWSGPFEIASGAAVRHAGLQTILTYGADEEGNEATLVHAAWWSVSGFDAVAEYGLVAFEDGAHVSTHVEVLNNLHEHRADGTDERENTGTPLHPPLAIARAERGVDIVYGAPDTTKLTKVRVEPRIVIGNARIWKPLGRYIERTGPARLVTSDQAPVQAFISTNGRIVLYKPDAKFRFVVCESGNWTAEQMILLDEKLTSEEMLRELRRAVDEMGTTETGPISQ